MSTSKRIVLIVLLLAVLAGGGAYGWTTYWRVEENDGRLELLGNVDVRQVNLAFKVAGRVGRMLVNEGDQTSSGQILASLEKGDLEDQLGLAQAQLDGQRAVVAELEAGTRPEDIEQAKALVAQRQAALQLAEVTLTRQTELSERNFTPHAAHDEAQTRRNEAAALLRAAEQALALAEAGPRRETIAAARAKLDADRASFRLAERRLFDADLKAPNDGVVLTRVREPGAIVGAGETIYTLTLVAPVWVRTYVDEPDLGRIRPGQTAEVRTDAGGVYQGRIGFISPVAEFTPKSVETRSQRTSLVYRLRVIVDEPDSGLKQGMPVTVTLDPAQGG